MDPLQEVLARQDGVVARAQLREGGCAPHDIRRLLRRRGLVRVWPGVYVDHTGVPSRHQWEWAAVLALWPAALCHESALPTTRRKPHGSVIHVAVDRARSPSAPPGVRLHRLAALDQKVLWSQSPPRMRVEEAALDVAADAVDDLEAIATLTDVVQARCTTAARLRGALVRRRRIARRQFLDAVLGDVSAGTCSVLEHAYLTRVERPHALPAALRQVRQAARGSVYRDVVYLEFDTYVELDGRLFHDTAPARDRDLDRDLDAAAAGRLTIRLGWGQVFGRPCDTALRVGAVLRRRGWTSRPVACPACPEP